MNDMKYKYTAICEDTGEEITGFLVKCNGKVNAGNTYICPATDIVDFKGTDEQNAPLLAIGPFYKVIADTVVPANGNGYDAIPTSTKEIFSAFGLDLDNAEEVNDWVERGRWYVRRCEELGEENRKLQERIDGYYLALAKKLKNAIINRLCEEQGREISDLASYGMDAVVSNANRIAINNTIIANLMDCNLQLEQCKALFFYNRHNSLLGLIRLQLTKTRKNAYGDQDITNAIFDVVHSLNR